MAVDAVAQAKHIGLLLHPLVVGVGHAFLDAGMADRLERAGEVLGVFLPKGADQRAAPLGIGLVPHGDVVLDEGLQGAHGADMARPARAVDNLPGNQRRWIMQSWPKIHGSLAHSVDANSLRESPLKRPLREET